MTKGMNIFNFSKTLIMLLLMMFMLAGCCGQEEGGSSEQSAVPSDGVTTEEDRKKCLAENPGSDKVDCGSYEKVQEECMTLGCSNIEAKVAQCTKDNSGEANPLTGSCATLEKIRNKCINTCEPNAIQLQKCHWTRDKCRNIVEAQQGTCWISAIIGGLYDAIGTASLEMYNHITNGADALMMIAFAVWFSFKMLEHVSSVREVNPAEFWTEVLRKLFICLFCGLLASSTTGLLYLLNLVIFPIYNAMLEFGSEILSASTNVVDATDAPIICKVTGNTRIDTRAEILQFPSAPRQMMECLACAVWTKLNFGFELGYRAMKLCSFMAFLVGLLIIIVFTIVKIGFAFYLVDTVFKMGIMLIILPLLVMSFAFKSTSKYAKKGFFIIINSAGFMMFIAIVISMTLLALDELINKQKIINTEGESPELSVTILCLLLLCFLVVASIGVAQEVTNSLVGGNSQSKFNEKVKVVGQMVLGAITGGATFALKKIALVQKAQKKFNKFKKAANKLAGRE